MPSGNWKIEIGTEVSEDSVGGGVISFRQDTLFGGDSIYYFFGVFKLLKGKRYRIKIIVNRHIPLAVGVFGDRDKIELDLEGFIAGDNFDFIGWPDFDPKMNVTIRGRKLSDR